MDRWIEDVRAVLDVSQWEISRVDIGAIVGYFVLMIVVGLLVKDISKDVSDYVRMGCKSTWWLMGLSLFISSISAATFTGGGAQAYMAGWSIVVIGAIGSAFGWICGGLLFAPWMRRTRAVTPADAIRQRFGPAVEQIWVYACLFTSFWGGVWLYSLAAFIAAAFNVPMVAVIVVTGVVVVFYSVLGGSWSAQITDALQSMLIMSIAIVVTFLSLKAIGGLDGLFAAIKAAGLEEDYAIIKDPGHIYTSKVGKIGDGFFTWPWLIVSFVYSFVIVANMTGCHRYLSTKNDSEARKAAFLTAALMVIGSCIWFLPAMVGRLQFEDEIDALAAKTGYVQPVQAETPNDGVNEAETAATGNEAASEAETAAAGNEAGKAAAKRIVARPKLQNPADGAYAVVAKRLLPRGLLGLVIVAMFAATMAAMDGNLTGAAGLVTRNLYPPLVRLFGGTPWEGRKLLVLTKLVNLGFGAWAICIALFLYATGGGTSIYERVQNIVSLLGVPLSLPFVLSFFVRRLPSWAPLVGMFTALIHSAVLKFGTVFAGIPVLDLIAQYSAFADGLPWHWRMPISMALAILPTGAMVIFWSTADEAYRRQVDQFFKQRDTPVDFKMEVGKDSDHSLLKVVGGLGMMMAATVSILLLFARDWTERGAVLFIVGFMSIVFGPLYVIGVRKSRVRALSDAAEASAAVADRRNDDNDASGCCGGPCPR